LRESKLEVGLRERAGQTGRDDFLNSAPLPGSDASEDGDAPAEDEGAA
jgi:hypothetical protein